jgi:acyl carrier protein
VSGTLEELQRLLRERLERDDTLAPETELVGDLALDSIQQLDLVVEVENHFGVSLELDEDQSVLTIGDLVVWIERARAAEPARG